MNYDPNRSNWFNDDIEYLINNVIVEYDMKNAGLSIIKAFRLLDDETIKRLEEMDKKESTIEVGRIQGKDKEFSQKLLSKFIEMRSLFIGANNLSSERIIAVKKDAFFTIDYCENTKFGMIEFRPKNIYSSYIRFVENSNIELYYSENSIEVKGIQEYSLNKHRLHALEFLKEYFSKLENRDPFLKRILMKHIDEYKSGDVEEEFYIEFNNKSKDLNPLFNYQKLYIPLVQIAMRELR